MNKKLFAVYLVLATFLAAAPCANAQLSIGTNFTGVTAGNSPYEPPDTMGSVGTKQIVEFVNGVYAVYNKSDGSAAQPLISDQQFWTNAGIANVNHLSDTRIIYDQATQRWFATELTTDQSTGNFIYVARSNSSDPTAGWKGGSFQVSATTFSDYDTLGVNADGLYIGANQFTNGTNTGTFSYSSLSVIKKSDLLLDTPQLSVTNFNVGGNFTPQGATDFGASSGSNNVYTTPDTTNIGKITVTNPAGATTIATGNIAVQTYTDPSEGAHQPDGTNTLDGGDSRIGASVVKQGDFVYLVHSTNVITANGNRVGIRLTILRASTGTVLSGSTISDPNYDYTYPSISANASGKIVIGFSRSGTGATDYVGAFARAALFDGTNLNFMGDDILLKAGEGNIHGNFNRWGDYSATVNDPNNSNIFWTFQEYAGANNQWATRITQLSFDVPEASTLWLIGTAAIPLWLNKRRRSR